jgi:hypothetical protein
VLSAEGGWGYELAPGAEPVLRTRTPWRPHVDDETALASGQVNAAGAIVEFGLRIAARDATGPQHCLTVFHERARDQGIVDTFVEVVDVCAGPAWLAALVPIAGSDGVPGLDVRLFGATPISEHARLRLGGVDPLHVNVRLQSDALVACDAAGRIVALSLATGELVVHTRARWP